MRYPRSNVSAKEISRPLGLLHIFSSFVGKGSFPRKLLLVTLSSLVAVSVVGKNLVKIVKK